MKPTTPPHSSLRTPHSLDPIERVCAGATLLFALFGALALATALAGCVNPNTGTCTIIGEQLALPEITDSSDSIAVRVYESIKGARVWTAKDSVVSVEYANAYTNTYFGIVEMRDSMRLKVKVEPCEIGGETEADDAPTNAVPVHVYLTTPAMNEPNVMLTNAES